MPEPDRRPIAARGGAWPRALFHGLLAITPNRISVLSLALIGAGSATAEPLSSADLVREITDNTLTGHNGSLFFSEFHAPDGRVLGHNAGVPNQDSCWKVREDAVCYYYPRDRRNPHDGSVESCWSFERAGSEGYKITPTGSARSGVARLEPGNPRGHTDNGRAWTCDAQISRRELRQPAPSHVASRGGTPPVEAHLGAARSP